MTSRDTKVIHNDQAWHEYAVDYWIDGHLFSRTIQAMDDDHAKQVLDAIKTTGVLGDRIVGVIDA